MEQRKAMLSEICKLVGVEYIGKDTEINGLNLCNRPTRYDSILGYVTSNRFFDAVFSNQAVKAVVLSEELHQELETESKRQGKELSYIISEEPEFLYYDIHNLLWNKTDFYDHYTAEPVVGENCRIHPSAVIETGVVIGNNVVVGPNSVIRSGSVIDDNVSIGCCSVIGGEGFQAIKGYDKMIKHVGGTHICHDVYIADNTTIGNSLFEGAAEVGAYTIINNHCHIAHNTKIGEHCVVTACCLMMGSTVLEDGVWLAPNSVVRNGRTVKQGATVGTLAFVNKDVEAGTTVIGIPAKELVK